MSELTVLVDAMSARLGGGLSFLTRQIAAIERTMPEVDLEILAAPWNVERLTTTLKSPVQLVNVPNPYVRYAYEQTILPLRRGSAQVLYCPGNFGPLPPARLPTVLAIQNPNFYGRGRAEPHNRRLMRRTKIVLSRWSARRADRVVLISESLMAEVLADMPELAPKAVLVPSGAPTWPDEALRPAGFAYDTDDYVVSLANDAPHKQLDRVIDAWTIAAGRDGRAPALVLVGDVSADRQRTQRGRVPRELWSRLAYLGPLDYGRRLEWVIRNARALVAASSLEAHPLTPAEAGSLGCPLILSDIPAHREVAGAHARYVPVGDQEALSTALADPPSGPAEPWRWPMSWEDHATKLVSVFRDVAALG